MYITGSYFKTKMNTVIMRSKKLLIIGEDTNINNFGDFVDKRNFVCFHLVLLFE